jgi:hypothetical protein
LSRRATSLPDTPAVVKRSTSRTWRIAVFSAGIRSPLGKAAKAKAKGTVSGPAEAPWQQPPIRATSSRNGGRNHPRNAGDIKSDWRTTSFRIRERLPPESAARRDWFFVALIMWLSDLGLIVAGLIVLWDPDPMAAVGAIEMITKIIHPPKTLFRRSLILQPNHLADLVPLPGSGHRPHRPLGAEHLELFARFPRDGWDSVGHQEGIQARR